MKRISLAFSIVVLIVMNFTSLSAFAQFGIGGQLGFHHHPSGDANYLSSGGHVRFAVLKKEFMVRAAVSMAKYESKEEMNALANYGAYVTSVRGVSSSKAIICALDVQKYFSKTDTLNGGYAFLGMGLTFGKVKYEIAGFDNESMSIGVYEGREVMGDETFARIGGGYDFELVKHLKFFFEGGLSVSTNIVVRTSTTVGPLKAFTGNGFFNGGVSLFF